MDQKEFIDIIKKYRLGKASKEEQKLIESYYKLFELEDDANPKNLGQSLEDKIFQRILKETENSRIPSTRSVFLKIAAAALVLVALGVALYGLKKDFQPQSSIVSMTSNIDSTDILPAKPKAVLTLSNGEKILLGQNRGSLLHGKIQQDSGSIVYQNKQDVSEPVKYNTLTTPKGGKFKITLVDGSTIWLNAGSTLRYPTAFTKKERKVYIEGEAFFDIAPLKNKPFKVEVKESEIQVLGTQFNVRSYPEMTSSQASLISGKIKTVYPNGSKLLAPGEQAIFNSKMIATKKVNLDVVLAWKNNLFYFDQTNIKDIMNELARWYDVKVIYKKKDLAHLNFNGIISRYADIRDVLERLSLTGTIHFKIENHKIYVLE